MKININSINPTLIVEVTGTEAWLKNIYGDFFPPDAKDHARLTGKIKLLEEEAGTYLITGDFRFEPVLPCGRCDKSIKWPVKFEINTRYLPAITQHQEKEKNLSRTDLEAYYIADNRIDIEVVINDSLNDQLPDRAIRTAEDGSTCLDCGKDVSDDKIWSSQDEKPSPFSVLKGLKLPN
jgi:uncharacterized metal-binding protein YceD (DUF177 family)